MNEHKLIVGDVWAGLLSLEDNSINCTVTSPPYWLQRDYGFEGQIGNELKLNDYLSKLVTIFRLLRQKLVTKGIFFLNIGDKYVSKYGNTPLSMIPFKLAYFLVADGWILNDILIWYKVNHMPSSVKNRFTNAYEPIFVLSKSNRNYYSDFKSSRKFSTILRLPLQPLPLKHMATFPEILVENLLKLGIPNEATILDPFAGSGTTCIAVQNYSKGYFNPINMQSIMVEANPEYERIIRERCKIKAKNVYKVSYQPYSYTQLQNNYEIPHDEERNPSDFQIQHNHAIIKIFKNSEEFIKFSPLLFNGKMFEILKDDGILFIGLLKPTLSDVYTVSQAKAWIIRNLIVIPQENEWIPIFMLVKDIKSVRYRFNIDNVRVAHKSSITQSWSDLDFVGYRVLQSSSLFKSPQEGLIAKILSYYNNGFPHWIVVKWNSGEYTLEEAMDEAEGDSGIDLYCPNCKSQLLIYYHHNEYISCPHCTQILWKDLSGIPFLKLKNPPKKPKYEFEDIKVSEKSTKNIYYNGKFKDADRINLGQSPGARVSVEAQYFSVMRYYNINQAMISEYLNLLRREKGLSKNQLTNEFPLSYKHTVGHWLRKDMGGSLPKYEDLVKLKSILDISDSYFEFIGRVGLKLQTVRADSKGKNPSDFLDFPLPKVIRMLKKVVES